MNVSLWLGKTYSINVYKCVYVCIERHTLLKMYLQKCGHNMHANLYILFSFEYMCVCIKDKYICRNMYTHNIYIHTYAPYIYTCMCIYIYEKFPYLYIVYLIVLNNIILLCIMNIHCYQLIKNFDVFRILLNKQKSSYLWPKSMYIYYYKLVSVDLLGQSAWDCNLQKYIKFSFYKVGTNLLFYYSPKNWWSRKDLTSASSRTQS